jgi:hypothetical protein
MTDTDNVVDLDEAKVLARYRAAVDFLKQPLAAASEAAHELRSNDDADDAVEQRIMAMGYIAFMMNDLCNAKLQLLESIASLLWSDDEHSDDEHEHSN